MAQFDEKKDKGTAAGSGADAAAAQTAAAAGADAPAAASTPAAVAAAHQPASLVKQEPQQPVAAAPGPAASAANGGANGVFATPKPRPLAAPTAVPARGMFMPPPRPQYAARALANSSFLAGAGGGGSSGLPPAVKIEEAEAATGGVGGGLVVADDASPTDPQQRALNDDQNNNNNTPLLAPLAAAPTPAPAFVTAPAAPSQHPKPQESVLQPPQQGIKQEQFEAPAAVGKQEVAPEVSAVLAVRVQGGSGSTGSGVLPAQPAMSDAASIEEGELVVRGGSGGALLRCGACVAGAACEPAAAPPLPQSPGVAVGCSGCTLPALPHAAAPPRNGLLPGSSSPLRRHAAQHRQSPSSASYYTAILDGAACVVPACARTGVKRRVRDGEGAEPGCGAGGEPCSHQEPSKALRVL